MGITLEDKVRVVKTSSKPSKAPPEKLPWPRKAVDDQTIELGVDVEAKFNDINKIVYKYFKVSEVTMDELLQEVFVAIIHKNHTKSAHDPRKSSFGHYIYMISNNVCINIVNKKKRFSKEKDSLDIPSGNDDSRNLIDTIEALTSKDEEIIEYINNVESNMRKSGHRDLARYVRAVKSGASPEIVREALTWGDRKISNKTIRDFRNRVRDVLEDY